MGLDMFAYRTKQKLGKDVNFENEEIDEDQLVELQSWRKHPNLHGYFESVFLEKGGTGVFNCQSVVLTEDDLHELPGEDDILPLVWDRIHHGALINPWCTLLAHTKASR